MLFILEGLVMCFILLVICVVGIANGPVGLVVFYEKNVQDRVVELGYTIKENIQKTFRLTSTALFAPVLILVPAMVYGVNGAVGVWSGFGQMVVILWIMGLFDRVFIDWYWVEHTNAWVISGTEDLQPYIPRKVMLQKWVGTILGFPLISAILAGIITWIQSMT